MGDGKKWAAEQEEREAEERAAQALKDRVSRFMHQADGSAWVKMQLSINDSIKERLAQLNLPEVPMTADQHRIAAELHSFVVSLQ
jgi:hypothetical protein